MKHEVQSTQAAISTDAPLNPAVASFFNAVGAVGALSEVDTAAGRWMSCTTTNEWYPASDAAAVALIGGAGAGAGAGAGVARSNACIWDLSSMPYTCVGASSIKGSSIAGVAIAAGKGHDDIDWFLLWPFRPRCFVCFVCVFDAQGGEVDGGAEEFEDDVTPLISVGACNCACAAVSAAAAAAIASVDTAACVAGVAASAAVAKAGAAPAVIKGCIFSSIVGDCCLRNPGSNARR